MDAGLLSTVNGFKFTSRKHRISDDDAVDRINAFYTPLIIIIISTVIMTKMYVIGQPIECWVPKEFSEAWEQYVESYCWVKNTYFVAPNDSLPSRGHDRETQELKYYQWVPFVLALQAFMFYLPSFIWKLLNWQSGIQLKSLVSMAVQCMGDDSESRGEKVSLAAKHISFSIVSDSQPASGMLAKAKVYSRRLLLCGLSGSGSYLTAIYLLIKLLYIANCVGQFFLLNSFLDTDYNFYGVQVLMDLWQNRDWRHSGHFPRVTLCDFDVRVVGNYHPQTLQCVLVVNLLNEKIFIFLWFLLLLVSMLTILDAIDWLLWSLLPSRRFGSLRRYIGPRSAEEEQLFSSFTRRHLKPDGAFVLRMISKNAGGPVVRDILQLLWQYYCEQQRQLMDNSDANSDANSNANANADANAAPNYESVIADQQKQ